MPRLRRVFSSVLLLILLACGGIAGMLLLSLPAEEGQLFLPGLSAEATISADSLGIPDIKARNRNDALLMLGYLHARDRLFQMELMRRKTAGRLAELFGDPAVESDRVQRSYQLTATAKMIVQDLPAEQRQALEAYVAGVNAYIAQAVVFPPEFVALQLAPEPWQAEDSILVILGMFQILNGQEQDERMVSVMEQVLPEDLVTFLTPDTDRYATVLVGGPQSRRFHPAVPAEALAALPNIDNYAASGHVDAENAVAGSNNWAVAGSKTRDGRAMIANDMHLGLGIPNVWYRADLHYQDRHLYGVTLPGVPGIVVGGNDHVAWGFTNATADLLDLVSLETDPDRPDAYRTPQGWKAFGRRSETIRVKNAPDIEIVLRDTIWGPVSERPLLGRQVAVKWTALERHAVDLALLDMDGVQSVQDAMTAMNNAGGPPQNVVFADRQGHIGWTYMGRFPLRVGFDGLTSHSWADGDLAWQGFIPPQELPRLLDPAEGFIATANNRTLGREYPHALGHNWALGYRAFRIAELLRQQPTLTETDLLAIQLDNRSAVLDFYQTLALTELAKTNIKDGELQEIETTLQAWDGRMGNSSIGAALLAEFRSRLAEQVFAKVVAACQTRDPDFRYAWREMETPLRLLLEQRPRDLLATRYRNDWHAMIVDTLRDSKHELQQEYPQIPLAELEWGKTHTISLQHPFSKAMPFLSSLLDMPSFAGDGCASVCVKVLSSHHGASERLVLSPNHPEDAIFHMPGGQSGHPLSQHYRDQQILWAQGIAAPLLAGTEPSVLSVKPQ